MNYELDNNNIIDSIQNTLLNNNMQVFNEIQQFIIDNENNISLLNKIRDELGELNFLQHISNTNLVLRDDIIDILLYNIPYRIQSNFYYQLSILLSNDKLNTSNINIINILKYISENNLYKFVDMFSSSIDDNVINYRTFIKNIKKISTNNEDIYKLYLELIDRYSNSFNIHKNADIHGDEGESLIDSENHIASKIIIKLLTMERKKLKDGTPVKDGKGVILSKNRIEGQIYIDTVNEQYRKKSNEQETRSLSHIIKFMNDNNLYYLDSKQIRKLDMEIYHREYSIDISLVDDDILNDIILCYSKINKILHTNISFNQTIYKSNYSDQSLRLGKQKVFRFDIVNDDLISNIFDEYSNIFIENINRVLKNEYVNRVYLHSTSSKHHTSGWIRFHIIDDIKTIFIDENQTDVLKNIAIDELLNFFKNRALPALSIFFNEDSIRSITNSDDDFRGKIIKIANDISNFLLISQMKRFQTYLSKEYPDYTIILPSSKIRKALLGGLPSPSGYDNVATPLNFKSKQFKDIQLYNYLYNDEKKYIKAVEYEGKTTMLDTRVNGEIFVWNYLNEMLISQGIKLNS